MLVRFALAALLALVLVTQLGAPPAGAAPQGELLFRDDFEDEIKDDWYFPGDDWKIEDGCFVTANDVPQNSLCWATLEDLACPPDLSLKTAVVWRKGSILLVLRTEDERSVACLTGQLAGGGYWFEQDEDGNWSVLASYEREWGKRNVITLEAQGNKLTLLVDGDKVSSITLRSLPDAGCVRVGATEYHWDVQWSFGGKYQLKASEAPMLEYIEVRSLD